MAQQPLHQRIRADWRSKGEVNALLQWNRRLLVLLVVVALVALALIAGDAAVTDFLEW